MTDIWFKFYAHSMSSTIHALHIFFSSSAVQPSERDNASTNRHLRREIHNTRIEIEQLLLPDRIQLKPRDLFSPIEIIKLFSI